MIYIHVYSYLHMYVAMYLLLNRLLCLYSLNPFFYTNTYKHFLPYIFGYGLVSGDSRLSYYTEITGMPPSPPPLLPAQSYTRTHARTRAE